MAVRGGFALTPVVIRCEPPTLTKGEKWYHVPVRRPRFVIDVHLDVPPARSGMHGAGTDDAMAVRRLTQSLFEFFSRRSAVQALEQEIQGTDHLVAVPRGRGG